MGNNSSSTTTESSSVAEMQSKVDELNKRLRSKLVGSESLFFELALEDRELKTWKRSIRCMVTLNGGQEVRELTYEAFHRIYQFLCSTISRSAPSSSGAESGSDVDRSVSQLKHSDGVKTRGEPGVETFNDQECVICMMRQSDILLPCLHSYCTLCISDWVQQNQTPVSECPTCRAPIRSERLIADSWTLLEDTPTLSFVWEEICKESTE